MNITQIKTAVDAGKDVRWSNDGYVIFKDSLERYLVKFTPNGYTIGLTDVYGERPNINPDLAYIKGEPTGRVPQINTEVMIVPMRSLPSGDSESCDRPEETPAFYDVCLLMRYDDDIFLDADWSFATYEAAQDWAAELLKELPYAQDEDLTRML